MIYTARARRSGSWWAIDVPELPGVYSQARRLVRVESMARDAIALFLDVDPATLDIRVETNLPSELRRDVDAVGRLRAEADRLQAESSGALRHLTQELLGRGLSVRDAAAILGISHQRVSQLVRAESKGREGTG
ncbi:MAG TPA: type II toxin-antitoxin system HicB family antitoxin [Coriobacteriia bacterium]|jgi:predicted RNase H-like HicB family nuclease